VRILLIAPPGAGKGTQGAVISAHFHVPRIATGDLLRDHVARGTEIGRAAKSHIDSGELVPDEIILAIVREAAIAVKAAGGGYVLDGVPRTIEQARAIFRIAQELDLTADVALHLDVDDQEVIRRLLARAAVEHRSDDTREIIQRRLRLYHRVTAPILAWYAQRGILLSIDAARPVEVVTHAVLAALEAQRRVSDEFLPAARSVQVTEPST
jgi:adenylate kinase